MHKSGRWMWIINIEWKLFKWMIINGWCWMRVVKGRLPFLMTKMTPPCQFDTYICMFDEFIWRFELSYYLYEFIRWAIASTEEHDKSEILQ